MMNDSRDKLSPATTEEISLALEFGLLWDGRKRIHRGDQLMAKLMAEHLIAYLQMSNFVIMKKTVHPADMLTHYNYSSPPKDGGGDDF